MRVYWRLTPPRELWHLSQEWVDGAPVPDAVCRLCQKHGAAPTYTLPSFAW